MKIWASQGLTQNDALWILWVSEKLKETEYSTNQSVIHSGVLPAQASMTLYQDDQLSWLSSPEHHVECQWIHPERNQLEVAALDTEPTGPASQEYGVGPEVASRVVADLEASDLALDAFSSGTSANLRVCEKYWRAQDSAWKKQ